MRTLGRFFNQWRAARQAAQDARLFRRIIDERAARRRNAGFL
jgi:hypothetical protein